MNIRFGLIALTLGAGLVQGGDGVSTSITPPDLDPGTSQAPWVSVPPAPAPATDARVESVRAQVRAAAGQLTRRERTRIEFELEQPLTAVNREASHRADRVLARIAAEFSTTPQALSAMREARGVPLADVLAACTLAAQGGPLDATEILRLHDEGLGWSGIAYGLGYDLRDLLKAVRSEARVALGRERPDGRVAAIESTGEPTVRQVP